MTVETELNDLPMLEDTLKAIGEAVAENWREYFQPSKLEDEDGYIGTFPAGYLRPGNTVPLKYDFRGDCKVSDGRVEQKVLVSLVIEYDDLVGLTEEGRLTFSVTNEAEENKE